MTSFGRPISDSRSRKKLNTKIVTRIGTTVKTPVSKLCLIFAAMGIGPLFQSKRDVVPCRRNPKDAWVLAGRSTFDSSSVKQVRNKKPKPIGRRSIRRTDSCLIFTAG
jgi:hypothetical protein